VKRLIALYKAHRGGEWLDASLRSIASHVDGVAFVMSRKAWTGGEEPNNCLEVASQWQEKRPGWLRLVWHESAHQEDQYRAGLQLVRDGFGADSSVLVIDTDEIWEQGSVAAVRQALSANPQAQYFCGGILSYVRSPLYQVYPQEASHPVMALQSACNQPLAARFARRDMGRTVTVDGARFHHMTYVRECEEETAAKYAATSSQEQVPSRADWLQNVWPRLPLGRNLHMTPGYEYCWPEIKVLARPPFPLPAFCREVVDAEDARWREMVAIEPPETTIYASPSDADEAKYPEFGNLATDVTFLRKRLKMTYLESLVLHREASAVPPDGKLLEIGSGDGGSLAVMSLASRGELWAIDPFTPYDELARSLVRGVREGNEENFWATANHYGYSARVRQVKKNSDVAAAECPDGAFDLILVDGNHSPEIAMSDLRLYWPKLKPGGTMLIHDYTTRFPGVIQACREWEVPHSVFAGTSLAYARKPA